MRYERLGYLDVLSRDLKVMDASAVSLARENKIPILVFSLQTSGAFARSWPAGTYNPNRRGETGIVAEPELADIERRMNGAIEALRREFAGLRTGRASVALLEPLTVEAYGNRMPINQVGTIGVPDPRMLTVQVWDQGQVGAVERAIRDSGLGLNPQTEGNIVRVPIPQLTEERRVELTKVANKYAEQARVAVRNVRRDGVDRFRKKEKDGEISQDEQRAWSTEIQQLTDVTIAAIDAALSTKEAEILQV